MCVNDVGDRVKWGLRIKVAADPEQLGIKKKT